MVVLFNLLSCIVLIRQATPVVRSSCASCAAPVYAATATGFVFSLA